MQITQPMLEEYEGSLLSLETLSEHDRKMLDFFLDKDIVDDPFLDFNFSQDLTSANTTFEKLKTQSPDATFTSFLIWCSAKSLCQVRNLNWRKFEDRWYEFKNPPFYMPVSTGKASRLTQVIFKKVAQSSFQEFSAQYLHLIREAREKETPAFAPPEMYHLAHLMNNFPDLRFTSYRPHHGRNKSTHVRWVFGQRYEDGKKLTVPMMLRINHSNGDPMILAQLLRIFYQYLDGTRK